MDITVTGIERRARGIVTVTVAGDEGRAHPLPLEALILHRIHEGGAFPTDEWERIRADGAVLLATRLGLELLARKQRTEHELREALSGGTPGQDFLETDIDGALARLHELGYLDDRAWASRYVTSSRADGRSEAALRRDLRTHGVADEDMSDALEGRDDLEAALDAARHRARALHSLEEATGRRRLYDFLRRRGFADGIARHAADAALAGGPAGAEAAAEWATEAPSRPA